EFLGQFGAQPLATVAGTIFPADEYVRHGARGIYKVYPEDEYPNITPENPLGTYAHRLIRARSDESVQPLRMLVERLKKQLTNGKRMRSCYELSVSDVSADLPLYDPVKDGADFTAS